MIRGFCHALVKATIWSFTEEKHFTTEGRITSQHYNKILMLDFMESNSSMVIFFHMPPIWRPQHRLLEILQTGTPPPLFRPRPAHLLAFLFFKLQKMGACVRSKHLTSRFNTNRSNQLESACVVSNYFRFFLPCCESNVTVKKTSVFTVYLFILFSFPFSSPF